MAQIVSETRPQKNGYPTRDGRPMGETDTHRNLMFMSIDRLDLRYALEADVYVSGNLLVFYRPGDRRRHLSPDVFVVFGVPKRERLNYLIWEEGKAPDVIIEFTSNTTRSEDLEKKFLIYQNEWKVPEYFLFDPLDDYLEPRLRGFRLRGGSYTPIRPVKNRLPSRVLKLHLEAQDRQLQFFDPLTQRWLPTSAEVAADAEEARRQSEEALEQSEAARQLAEAENVRLRAELRKLRRGDSGVGE